MYPLSMQIEVWHPDASEEHYLAELRYDRRSGGEINLLFSSQMESCLSHGPPNFLNELPLQRLEGVAVYDRNRHLPLATSISLRGITGGTTFGLFSTSIATYKVKDIYFGDGVPVHDNVEIKEVIWALEGVESWLDPITERFSSGHPDRETWKLEYPIEGLGNLSIYKEAFSLPIMSIQYEAARSISESDKIVSYIQNLITLATGKFHPILWLKCVISGNIAETGAAPMAAGGGGPGGLYRPPSRPGRLRPALRPGAGGALALAPPPARRLAAVTRTLYLVPQRPCGP